jgi:hypothetical protein
MARTWTQARPLRRRAAPARTRERRASPADRDTVPHLHRLDEAISNVPVRGRGATHCSNPISPAGTGRTSRCLGARRCRGVRRLPRLAAHVRPLLNYRQVLRGESPLSVAERELIAVDVSARRRRRACRNSPSKHSRELTPRTMRRRPRPQTEADISGDRQPRSRRPVPSVTVAPVRPDRLGVASTRGKPSRSSAG